MRNCLWLLLPSNHRGVFMACKLGPLRESLLSPELVKKCTFYTAWWTSEPYWNSVISKSSVAVRWGLDRCPEDVRVGNLRDGFLTVQYHCSAVEHDPNSLATSKHITWALPVVCCSNQCHIDRGLLLVCMADASGGMLRSWYACYVFI
jgi:hypothetical protein